MKSNWNKWNVIENKWKVIKNKKCYIDNKWNVILITNEK